LHTQSRILPEIKYTLQAFPVRLGVTYKNAALRRPYLHAFPLADIAPRDKVFKN